MNVKKGMKNIAYSFLGQAITMILGIVIPKLVIESYGSEVNGLLSSVHQVLHYLALLEAGVGAASLQALYKPISDNNHESANSIMAATHHYYRRTGIVYLAAVVCIAFVYPLVVRTGLNYGFIAAIVIICGIPSVITYFFQGKLKIFLNANGDKYIITNLSTATSVFASIAKIALLLAGMNVIFVQTIYCVVSLIQMIFLYVYVKKKYPWMTVRAAPDKEALKQKNANLIHQICSLVTNSTDVLVLSVFCSLNVASIYAVYNMIFSLIANVTVSINGGVMFIFGNAYCKDRKYYMRVLNVYETYYTSMLTALMTITCIMMPSFLTLYTASADINYIDAWLPLLFALVSILNVIRNPSINTITVAGHFKQTAHHAIIESIINLVVSIALVNILNVWDMGLYGVLIGTIVAFLYRDTVSIRYANRKILERNNIFSVKILLLNVGLFALFVSTAYFFNITASNYGVWVICATVVSLIVITMFAVANSLVSPSSFKLVFEHIKSKMKNRKGKSSPNE